MASLLFPGNKGAQAIITAFFLVVVFVTVLLLLIFFNYKGAVQTEQLSKVSYFLEGTTTIRNEVDNCLKSSEKKGLQDFFGELDKCIPKQAKGYTLERMPYHKCTYAFMEAGQNTPCEHILTFYMNLPEKETKTCLARLKVCLGELVPTPKPTTPPPTPTPPPTVTPPPDPGILGDSIVIPTQPEFQKDPLKCHGLAYKLAELAEAGDPISIIRVAGPNNAFPGHNAGPYLVSSPKLEKLKTYIENVIKKNPEFKNVSFYYTKKKIDVPMELITSIRPLKTCILDGPFDKPSKLFTAMGIPHYTSYKKSSGPSSTLVMNPKWEECYKEKGLIIYGCDSEPIKGKDNDFVKSGGTLVHTDGWKNNPFIFPDYIDGKSNNDMSSSYNSLWEGTKKGTFDLPLNMKKFFQPAKESIQKWLYLVGTKLITKVGPKTQVLASGSYGGVNRPQAAMAEIGKGRYFFFAFHIEGGISTDDELFMSSLYSGTMASKLNVFPLFCYSEASTGVPTKACPSVNIDNHSFQLWPSVGDIHNVTITVFVDDKEVNWFVPSKNNFDVTKATYVDFEVTVPGGFKAGVHPVKIEFSSPDTTTLIVNGKLIVN